MRKLPTFFTNTRIEMSCNKCKSKTTVEQVIEENAILNNPSVFRLRSVLGAIQMSFGSGQLVSNANLTDELAIEFLRVNPNRISMFSAYPENLEELLSETNNESQNNDE